MNEFLESQLLNTRTTRFGELPKCRKFPLASRGGALNAAALIRGHAIIPASCQSQQYSWNDVRPLAGLIVSIRQKTRMGLERLRNAAMNVTLIFLQIGGNSSLDLDSNRAAE